MIAQRWRAASGEQIPDGQVSPSPGPPAARRPPRPDDLLPVPSRPCPPHPARDRSAGRQSRAGRRREGAGQAEQVRPADRRDHDVNRELEDKARSLAGIKGYITNLRACPDGTPVTAEFVISVYRQLFEIERSFRMAKSDLQARPIYHRKRDSIEAHLTIVFAALAVSRWIERQTGWSIRKFVKTARRYRTIEIQAGPHTITAADPLPGELRRPRNDQHRSTYALAWPKSGQTMMRQLHGNAQRWHPAKPGRTSGFHRFRLLSRGRGGGRGVSARRGAGKTTTKVGRRRGGGGTEESDGRDPGGEHRRRGADGRAAVVRRPGQAGGTAGVVQCAASTDSVADPVGHRAGRPPNTPPSAAADGGPVPLIPARLRSKARLPPGRSPQAAATASAPNAADGESLLQQARPQPGQPTGERVAAFLRVAERSISRDRDDRRPARLLDRQRDQGLRRCPARRRSTASAAPPGAGRRTPPAARKTAGARRLAGTATPAAAKVTLGRAVSGAGTAPGGDLRHRRRSWQLTPGDPPGHSAPRWAVEPSVPGRPAGSAANRRAAG